MPTIIRSPTLSNSVHKRCQIIPWSSNFHSTNRSGHLQDSMPLIFHHYIFININIVLFSSHKIFSLYPPCLQSVLFKYCSIVNDTDSVIYSVTSATRMHHKTFCILRSFPIHPAYYIIQRMHNEE